ncbi:hypothetical protein MLD38_026781 [Melastoma candidum]|uniref:Uncharacterized protein n=1 Tax=Melastoma candidum TaxID=119954 RepID=A0ACB9P2V4_9MYRT|nr:hypothetical protein MLD38_026781 [Melastoma candidum]
MADNGKVHPQCPNAANPYHECFEECYVKMGKAKPQMVKSFSGLAGRDPVSRRKNREPSQQKKLEKVTTFPYVSTVEPNHASEIEPERDEFDEEKAAPIPPLVPYSGGIRSPEDFSFDKGQIKSSQSVPTSGQATPAIANSPDRRKNSHVALATSLLSAFADEPPKRAKHAPLRSSSSSTMDNDHAFQESDEDDVQSVISESRVTVGKYYVKGSLAPILRAILEKYGDITENCLMESVSMRSYSLECICLVVQELQSTSLTQLTTSKIKELLSILKDLENSRVRVDWLRRILDKLSEACDVIARHQLHKSEKSRYENNMEALRRELEAQLEDLLRKEREVEEAKARVTEMRERIRRGEIESSKLAEDTAALRSQLESFRFSALIDELLV